MRITNAEVSATLSVTKSDIDTLHAALGYAEDAHWPYQTRPENNPFRRMRLDFEKQLHDMFGWDFSPRNAGPGSLGKYAKKE